MMTPVCRVAIPEGLEKAFPLVRKLFDAVDLSIVNPHTGSITTWTEEGFQKSVSPATLIDDVISGAIRNIQFWRTASDDVFVSWKFIDGGCMFSIYLNGVDPELCGKIAGKIVEISLSEHRMKYGEGTFLSIDLE